MYLSIYLLFLVLLLSTYFYEREFSGRLYSTQINNKINSKMNSNTDTKTTKQTARQARQTTIQTR